VYLPTFHQIKDEIETRFLKDANASFISAKRGFLDAFVEHASTLPLIGIFFGQNVIQRFAEACLESHVRIVLPQRLSSHLKEASGLLEQQRLRLKFKGDSKRSMDVEEADSAIYRIVMMLEKVKEVSKEEPPYEEFIRRLNMHYDEGWSAALSIELVVPEATYSGSDVIDDSSSEGDDAELPPELLH